MAREPAAIRPSVCSASAEQIDEKIRNVEWRGMAEPADVALLCEALDHSNLGIQERAARALGRYAGPTAIEPLTLALKTRLGGSGRRYLMIGAILGLSLVVVLVFGVWGFDGTTILMLGTSSTVGVPALLDMRARSAVIRALAEALAELAERNPQPHLRQLVPELKLASLAVVQQNRATRKALQSAASRIERSVHDLKKLPVVSSAETSGRSDLPLPSDSPQGTGGP